MLFFHYPPLSLCTWPEQRQNPGVSTKPPGFAECDKPRLTWTKDKLYMSRDRRLQALRVKTPLPGWRRECGGPMPMKSPLHPGRIVKHECLEPLNLTVKRAAEILGVTRQALNNIVNEKAVISAAMAIRLEKAFGG